MEKIKKCYEVEVTHESDHTPHSNCNINYAFSLKIENNKRLGFDNFFIWKHLLFLFFVAVDKYKQLYMPRTEHLDLISTKMKIESLGQ